MRFDQSRVAVVAGDGVVARFPGIVCIARPAGHPAVADLVEHCAKAAGANPGRSLARRLAGWLSGPDAPGEDLEFGTVSAAGERLALFLLGDVTARVDGGSEHSGASAAAWSDQLVPFSEATVVLAAAATAVPADVLSGISDLTSGVVPGGGVAFAPSGASAFVRSDAIAPQAPVSPEGPPVGAAPGQGAPPAPPSVPEAAPVPSRPARTEVAPPVPPVQRQEQVVEPRAPRRSEAVSGAEALVERREPLEPGLPIGSRPQAPSVPSVPSSQSSQSPSSQSPSSAGSESVAGQTSPAPASSSSSGSTPAPAQPEAPEQQASGTEQPQTRGHLCSRGHLNDPRSHFCVLCGIRMNERTGVLVLGPRPPLGLLVFDNGATYTVDAEYLVGRTPETDERVRGGSLRPLTVEDAEGAVSRVHAEVRVRGWDVILVDSGSRNGTFVVPPGDQTWTPIASGKSHRLAPGTRVRLGEKRTFVFESPSGVR